MIETDVHDIIISYDDTNSNLNHFIAYLKNEQMKDKLKEYCDQARKNFDFSIEIVGNRGYIYILKYIGENKYHLKIK